MINYRSPTDDLRIDRCYSLRQRRYAGRSKSCVLIESWAHRARASKTIVAKKVADVTELVADGKRDPNGAFPRILSLARSADWQDREVAATALVEISKKRAQEVLAEMTLWAKDADANVRRTASEGLREIARREFASVVPVLELLIHDDSIYVKKSVANVLRNAGKHHPALVLRTCRAWTRYANRNTNWIIKDGLRKLRETDSAVVEEILSTLKQ